MTSEPTVLRSTAGSLVGRRVDGLHVFRGVPYAAPPVGAARFAPPRPLAGWSGDRDATGYGPVCPQLSVGLPLMDVGSQRQDEDCLYLNVWTPEVGAGRRPIMVWIHGGAFLFGSGSQPIYDGGALAAADVVVVTINYRLGALGYLAHPTLRDSETGTCGNWGLLDQIAAVAWVRENAAAIGGDPENITIFGESAGSMSATTLLGSPAAAGLARRVIAQSGAPMVAMEDEAAATAEAFLDAGNLSASELRQVSTARLIDAQAELMRRRSGQPGGVGANGEALMFRPVIDGATLPCHPTDAVAGGSAEGIDLLIGTNRDEMRLFTMFVAEDLDDAGLRQQVAAMIGAAADSEIERHRGILGARAERVTSRDLLAAVQTDVVFRAPARHFATAHAAHGSVRSYLFCWSSPLPSLGAAHAVELPFVFGTLDVTMMDSFAGAGPAADRLSARMRQAWTSFARTGVPTVDGVAGWPEDDGTGRVTMVIDDSWRVARDPDDEVSDEVRSESPS